MPAWRQLLADTSGVAGRDIRHSRLLGMLPLPVWGRQPDDGQPGSPDVAPTSALERELVATGKLQRRPPRARRSVVLREIMRLGHGRPLHYLARDKFANNAAWPGRTGRLGAAAASERYCAAVAAGPCRAPGRPGPIRVDPVRAMRRGQARRSGAASSRRGLDAPRSTAKPCFASAAGARVRLSERQARDPSRKRCSHPSPRARPRGSSAYWDEAPLCPRVCYCLHYTGLKGDDYLLTFRPLHRAAGGVRQAAWRAGCNLCVPCQPDCSGTSRGLADAEAFPVRGAQGPCSYLFARRNLGDGLASRRRAGCTRSASRLRHATQIGPVERVPGPTAGRKVPPSSRTR